MITNCEICGKSFDFKNRRDMSRFIAKVCSDVCFSLFMLGFSSINSSVTNVKEFEQRNNTYRSRYEEKTAKYLQKNFIKFLYEPYSFPLSDGSVYVPDFFLINEKVFLEVKGLYYRGAKKKIKLFDKEYKWPLFIVDYEMLKILKR